MALWLPRWATDCRRRRKPEVAADRPLALYEMQRSAHRLVACDEGAANLGLHAGQSLSDARALVPDLIAEPFDREGTIAVFADLADWHADTSPRVEVHQATDAYGDLMVDIKGVAHLFGGEAALLERCLSRLRAMGIAAEGAIADTAGAAWAFARHGGGIIAGEETETRLAGLPMAALRLPPETVFGLAQMGLKRVGQLYGRDRGGLKARFGTGLLLRLDQALGLADERLDPRLPAPDHHAERRFGEPIVLFDDVLLTIADLSLKLAGELEAARQGAQTFHLYLFRVDHRVMHVPVNAATATRDPAHMARLFANRLERVSASFDAGFGIDMIRLGASSLTPLTEAQLDMAEGEGAATGLDRLVDRMVSRIGPEAALRSKFVDTHIPEKAVRLEPMVARTPDDPGARPDARLPRPVRLLPTPEPIEVLAEIPDGPPARMVWRRQTIRLVRTLGPERIGVEWWNPGTEALTRDYFVAEDEEGRRFWLFREGLYGTETVRPRWFLHGFFA